MASAAKTLGIISGVLGLIIGIFLLIGVLHEI